MSKQTPNYGFGYQVPGEFTDPVTEQRRWNTADNLLGGLYQMVGDGVADGWTITAGAGLSVNIAVGRGVISKVAVESNSAATVASLIPSTSNYVFASLTQTSYWTGNVAFQVMVANVAPQGAIYIGTILTNSTGVISIDTSGRKNIGLVNSIWEAIKNHRHNGVGFNPPPVDLAKEVQGQLAPRNLPNLDASQVTTGVLSPTLIPKIDHTTGLSHIGALTHAQLDSVVESLAYPGKTLMGETALVNFLQLILALKPSDPLVDEEMVNEIAYIPGYSPDSMADAVNTTATIDTGGHKITVSASGSLESFVHAWTTSDQMAQAALENAVVGGDLIELAPTEITAEVEDFENVSDWVVSVNDLSSPQSATFTTDSADKVQGVSSGQLNVNATVQNNLTLTMEKTFAPQDWSQYNRITFQINTASLTHGDISFYLRDSLSGDQNSYTLVLERGSPTINRDTLQVGWREVSVDISAYARTSIDAVGFATSTQNGWNPSQQFTFNVDDMKLTTGNRFESNGTAIFTFGTLGFPVTWSSILWKALVPSDASILFRWREADTIGGMGAWSSYSSTMPLPVTSTTKALIQIEAALAASTDLAFSPELHRLQVNWTAVAAQDAFTYNTKAEWKSGSLSGIDTDSVPGSIRLADTGDVNGITYGVSGSLIKADDTLASLLTISGAALPKSTNQHLNGTSAGLGQVTSFDWGPDGSYFLADTDNDRVVQIGSDGKLLFGIYGAFTQEPQSPYGNEDNGAAPAVATTSTSNVAARPTVLHAIYNPTASVLSVIFTDIVEMVYDSATTLDRSAFYLGIGANRVHFTSDSKFQLFGIDGAKLAPWLNSGNVFLPQFQQQSNVLQITLSQADAATLNSLVNFAPPSLTCPTPLENQVYAPGSVVVTFGVNNLTLGGPTGYRILAALTPPSGPVVSQYLSVDTVTYSGLSLQGKYLLTATLVDSNDIPLGNSEAALAAHFIVTTGVDPTMCPTLVPNQMVSGGAVSIGYTTPNFSPGNVLGGPTIMYRIDGGNYVPWLSVPHSVDIEYLSPGTHTVDFYLRDSIHPNPPIASSPRGASITFHTGVSGLAGLKLYVGEGGISSFDRTVTTLDSVTTVDSGNIYMGNIYAPLEVQYLANEVSLANPNGVPSLLVGKLRCPSSTEAISATALPVASIVAAVTTGQQSLALDMVIFGTKYLDGHSVVQFDLQGNPIFSNNAAIFATTRASAKQGLGGVQKTNEIELLIADAINQRAVITHTKLTDQSTFVVWQYDSDRQVTDFRFVPIPAATVSVTASSVDHPSLLVSNGTTVTWTNNSSIPTTIYSGSATTAQFNLDPDLTLYGAAFISPTLQPGESYAYRFDNLGDFAWFAYPEITTASVAGVVHVSSNRIGPNDKYIIVENDPAAETTGGRVIRVDAWGNIEWTFGEGVLSYPRDARPLPDGSIVIST